MIEIQYSERHLFALEHFLFPSVFVVLSMHRPNTHALCLSIFFTARCLTLRLVTLVVRLLDLGRNMDDITPVRFVALREHFQLLATVRQKSFQKLLSNACFIFL